MRSILEAAQKWTHHAGANEHSTIYLFKDLSSSMLPILSRMQAVLSFVLYWLDTKLYHFLSGWSLAPFFMLVHWDLPILVEVLHMAVDSIKPLCVGQGGNYSWGLLPVQLEELQDILRKIKVIVMYCVYCNEPVMVVHNLLKKIDYFLDINEFEYSDGQSRIDSKFP
jgi:hypothetical protein